MEKDNQETRSFCISVKPYIFMKAYYTPGVHSSPNWYCILQYSFMPHVMNRRSKLEEDDNHFDITVPNEMFLMELIVAEGKDFEDVRKKGEEEANKILKNIPIHFEFNHEG